MAPRQRQVNRAASATSDGIWTAAARDDAKNRHGTKSQTPGNPSLHRQPGDRSDIHRPQISRHRTAPRAARQGPDRVGVAREAEPQGLARRARTARRGGRLQDGRHLPRARGRLLRAAPAANDPRSTATRRTPNRPGAALDGPRSGCRRSSTNAASTWPPSNRSRCIGSTPRAEPTSAREIEWAPGVG